VIVSRFQLLVSRGFRIILLGCRIVERAGGVADAVVVRIDEVLIRKAIAWNRCRVCIHGRVSEGHYAGIGRVSLGSG